MFSQTPLKVMGKETTRERLPGKVSERDRGRAPGASFLEVRLLPREPRPGSCHHAFRTPESSGMFGLREAPGDLAASAATGVSGVGPHELSRAPAGEARPFAPLCSPVPCPAGC